MKWYVYILKCQDGNFYTGLTTDLEKRFERHGAGRGSFYTKGHKTKEILYHEIFGNRIEASNREKQIKKWSRAKKLALIDGDKAKLQKLSKSND